MRIAVTGSRGQLASSLIERAHGDVEIVPLRRPAFALEDRRLARPSFSSKTLPVTTAPQRPPRFSDWRSVRKFTVLSASADDVEIGTAIIANLRGVMAEHVKTTLLGPVQERSDLNGAGIDDFG
jgi:hypothetical protein